MDYKCGSSSIYREIEIPELYPMHSLITDGVTEKANEFQNYFDYDLIEDYFLGNDEHTYAYFTFLESQSLDDIYDMNQLYILASLIDEHIISNIEDNVIISSNSLCNVIIRLIDLNIYYIEDDDQFFFEWLNWQIQTNRPSSWRLLISILQMDPSFIFNIGISFVKQIRIIMNKTYESSINYLSFILINNVVSDEEFIDVISFIIDNISSCRYTTKLGIIHIYKCLESNSSIVANNVNKLQKIIEDLENEE